MYGQKCKVGFPRMAWASEVRKHRLDHFSFLVRELVFRSRRIGLYVFVLSLRADGCKAAN